MSPTSPIFAFLFGGGGELMGIAFEADSVSVEGDTEYPRVVFSGERISDPPRLEFARVPTADGLGQAVECSWDQRGLLNGITRVLLTPTRVVVNLASRDPAEAKRDQELVVAYRAGAEELHAIRRALKQVFRDTGLFIDDAATGLGLVKAILIGPATPTSELLVVPTYMTVVGAIVGAVIAALKNPWWVPVGIIAGAPLGFVWGFLKRRRFYSLHTYQ